MTISPGENVGPYRVVEQLGSGGMATVYKGYQPSLDRYVAIKVMHPMFKGNPQFFERFKREARIVAKLEHPNIIPIHDFNEHKGEAYLVMRYVEGDTLKPHMEGQPMPSDEVLRVIDHEIAAGLDDREHVDLDRGLDGVGAVVGLRPFEDDLAAGRYR